MQPTSDRGSVTAEFAVALPALLMVFGLCMNGIVAAAGRVELVHQSAGAARLIARGVDETQAAHAVGLTAFTTRHDDGLVCVFAQHQVGIIPITARTCSLDAGQ